MSFIARVDAAERREAPSRRIGRSVAQARPWLLAGATLWTGWLIVRGALAGYFDTAKPSYALLADPDDVAGLNAAAQRLAATSPGNAAMLARRSLVVRPLNPVAFGILGQTRSATEDRNGAERLFLAAATWSRRDAFSEIWLYDEHLRRGDYGAAMEDVDRLIRVYPDAASAAYPSLIAMAADSRARPALVARLGQNPPWRTAFLWSLAGQARDPMVAAGVMMGMAGANPNTAPAPGEVAPLLTRLVDARQYLEAFLAWRQFAPDSQAALASVRDGDFQGLPAGGPFVWSLGQSAGSSAEIASAPNPLNARGQSLHVTYDGYSAAPPLASQLLVLGPGDYRFSTQVYAGFAVTDTRLSWTMTCADTGQSLFATNEATPLYPGWSEMSATATVPAGGCQGQWLRLAPTPGDRPASVELWFDHVAMSRIRPTTPVGANFSPVPRTKSSVP